MFRCHHTLSNSRGTEEYVLKRSATYAVTISVNVLCKINMNWDFGIDSAVRTKGDVYSKLYTSHIQWLDWRRCESSEFGRSYDMRSTWRGSTIQCIVIGIWNWCMRQWSIYHWSSRKKRCMAVYKSAEDQHSVCEASRVSTTILGDAPRVLNSTYNGARVFNTVPTDKR